MEKTKKSGLPDSLTMRHDPHFVELISQKSAGPVVRLIPIDLIDPNPRQPRSELGDIKELMDSIRTKGVLEPILVRSRGGRFEIIAGERRYFASKNLGLKEIPCLEMEVNDQEAMEISLIENLQRKDLDIFEEADGLKALIDLYNYSHQEIASRIGKSRSTITEILSVARIPSHLRDKIKAAGLTSRSTIIEIAKIEDPAAMHKAVEAIIERKLTRSDTRDLTRLFREKEQKSEAKTKPYVFNYIPPESKAYKLRIEFKKQVVTRKELISILEDLLNKLKSESEKKPGPDNTDA
ncbi:MAG TPA: ParB/RepB/Spo0J family partition protein [Candidatus Saccharicenans sp.]|nr:ParB/RepB/Spo0J family partition protein [Candidatus Saccharicenans sp.]HOL45928.1 ParB/RepB/Spo0J family partition protein [Candidatus Saccharicenans sp.]HOM93727.1 ParB/RepB/Spo0J family partition protein [Candidatus Saccharicenans sp.]HPP23968.1 ParB/RepB/Spo0J family partition protein [Candidatus Saccharicenans sp.]HRT25367.1 ParB/RepB/Spo0J family partition protein [Candidatus Saccharicenans sp.]